jgi:hypothetical protein
LARLPAGPLKRLIGEDNQGFSEESPPRRSFVGVNKCLERKRFEVASIVIY